MELEGTPAVENVPTVEPPFVIPSTFQITSLFLTAAGIKFNCTFCDVVILEMFGESVSAVIELIERMVTLEDPVLVESDCKTAVTVMVG